MNEPEMKAHCAHEEVALLLPWYINGALDGSERQRVEQHMRSCILCRRELAFESAALDLFRNDNALDQSASAGFEHLCTRIATAAPRSSAARHALSLPVRWLEKLYGMGAGPDMRPLLIAVPLALGVVGIALTMLMAGTGADLTLTGNATPGYETLSSERTVANQDDIHVILNPGIDAGVIDELLKSLPAEVVDGPNDAGVYTLRLLHTAAAGERQAAIVSLRKRPEVVFAEAAQPVAVTRSAPARSP